MALITPQLMARSGSVTTPTFQAADGGLSDWFANNGRRVFRWKNTSGSSITITIPIVTKVDGQTPASKTITIPATTGDITTDVFPADYNDTFGNVNASYSAVVGLTVAVMEFSKIPGT